MVDRIFGYSFVRISVSRENHQIRIRTVLDEGLHHSGETEVSLVHEVLHHGRLLLDEDNDRSIRCYSEMLCKLSYSFHSQSASFNMSFSGRE